MDKIECKAIMYHYIRDESDFMPNLKYLHIEDFKKQLDYFEKEYGFVKKEDWESFIINKTEPPKGVVLTFDDGLIDHYKFVLPILKEKKLWGIFFVCTDPLNKKNILNVHKIHYLLWRYSSKEIYEKMEELLSVANIPSPFVKTNKIQAYANYTMDRYSMMIKQINYLHDKKLQNFLLDGLLKHFHQSYTSIWINIYMDINQIKEIKDAGNIIGGHSKSHPLLARLSDDELEKEVITSNEALEVMLKSKIECFCYPYGVDDSYSDKVEEKLKQIGMKYAFCIDSQDITKSDILLNNYKLPRYDCTAFEYGKPRNL